MDVNIKRGIDFQNRFWESSIANKLKNTFYWWDGKPINRITFLGLFVVFFLNIFLVSSIFGKDLLPAFSSSAFLIMIADMLQTMHILSRSQFFSILSVASLTFAPISIYLFTRKIIHRHELSAFLATLLLVVPNPISTQGMPFLLALMQGDGAHAIVFSFVPLFLLYFKAFVGNGFFAWGFISAIGATLIAISSPFAFFNVLIFFTILTISEGFMGGLRIKIVRFLFVLFATIGLSYFWYYPNTITKILLLENVRAALSYFWSIFPLLIPIVPVIGAMSFLVFDRREKLQPVFVGIFLFAAYFGLSHITISYKTNTLFAPERYIIELSFAESFFLALILGMLFDLLFQKAKQYVNTVKNPLIHVASFFLFIGIFILIFAVSFFNIQPIRDDISKRSVVKQHSLGISSIGRGGTFSEVSSILSGLVSFFTFLLLVYILRYFPSKTPHPPHLSKSDTI